MRAARPQGSRRVSGLDTIRLGRTDGGADRHEVRLVPSIHPEDLGPSTPDPPLPTRSSPTPPVEPDDVTEDP